MSTDTKPSVVRYIVEPDNDLMQVYEGKEVGRLGLRLSPDTADLFAASPEMLDALRRYANDPCERTDGHCTMLPVDPCRSCEARAAIEKATVTSRRLGD